MWGDAGHSEDNWRGQGEKQWAGKDTEKVWRRDESPAQGVRVGARVAREGGAGTRWREVRAAEGEWWGGEWADGEGVCAREVRAAGEGPEGVRGE